MSNENKFDFFPVISPLKTPEELAELKQAAIDDGHHTVLPTHIVRKKGRIVGYMSYAKLPLIHTWLDTRTVGPRESFSLLNSVENMAAASGALGIYMPCVDNSPFYKLMPALGFKNLGQYDMNVKLFR